MEEQEHKHIPIVDISIKTESEGMTFNDKTVAASYAGAVLAAILALYRLVVLFLVFGIANFVIYYSHISAVFVFTVISAWLWYYGKYRSSWADLSIIQLLNTYSIMKALSFIASLCCALRFCSTIVYFMQLRSMNVITSLYVLLELILWLVLTVFFFLFWKSRRKNISRLKEDDFNTRLKM